MTISEIMRANGRRGGAARAAKLTKKRRIEIAKMGQKAWKKKWKLDGHKGSVPRKP